MWAKKRSNAGGSFINTQVRQSVHLNIKVTSSHKNLVLIAYAQKNATINVHVDTSSGSRGLRSVQKFHKRPFFI